MQAGDRQLVMRVLAQGWRYRWMIVLSLIGSLGSGMLMAYLVTQLQPFFAFMGDASKAIGASGAPATALNSAAQVQQVTSGLLDLGFKLLLLAPLAAVAAYLAW